MYTLDCPKNIKLYKNLEHLKNFYTNSTNMFYAKVQEFSSLNTYLKKKHFLPLKFKYLEMYWNILVH